MPWQSINRMKIGTPPVLANAALAASLKIWNTVDMSELRSESVDLSERLISRLKKTA